MSNKANGKDKQVTIQPEPPISITAMAPAGVDGRAWARLLKDQLLASKGGEVSNEELLYFAQVARSSGLDPSRHEIYGIYRGGKLTIQTGIDGLRSVAERSGKYAGSKEYEFTYDKDVKITVDHSGQKKTVPNSAKATVMKLMGDRVIETVRTARWEDYYPGDKMGMLWKKFPEVMLGKCAEAQALRAAFPNTAQLYIEEEVQTTPTEDSSIDMNKIAENIKNAKSLDELFEIITGLTVEQQKQVTDLATQKSKDFKGVKNATPKN